MKVENSDDLIVAFGFLIEEAIETGTMNLDDVGDAFDVAWAEAEEELRNKDNG